MYIVHNSTGTQKNKTYTAYVQNTVYTVHIIRQKPRRILYTYTRMCIYIYIYIYVCVYVYMYIYIYIHTHVCIYIYIYVCVCVYVYIYIYIFFFSKYSAYSVRNSTGTQNTIYILSYLLTYLFHGAESFLRN